MKCLSVLALPTAAAFAVGSKAMDRTMTKVINTLEEMLWTSEETMKEERVTYAKYVCYTDKETKEKKATIAQSESEIETYESTIQKTMGESGVLSAKVAKLKKQLEDLAEAVSQAEGARADEKAQFDSDKLAFEKNIAALTDAVKTLSDIGADQTADNSDGDDTKHAVLSGFLSKKSNLKKIYLSVEQAAKAAESLAPHVSQKLRSLLQIAKSNPANYSAQSGGIVGILLNMLDTFKDNLSEAVETEAAAVLAHVKYLWISAELKLNYETLRDEANDKLGDNDSILATTRTKLEESQKALSEATTFLEEVVAERAKADEHYGLRKEMRQKEQASLTQAINILTDDDLHETFKNVDEAKEHREDATGGYGDVYASDASDTSRGKVTSFLQISSESERKTTVLSLILWSAKKTKSLRLAKIAMLLQTGNPFTKVLKLIEEMKQVIVDEEQKDKDDIAWCDNERETKNRVIAAHEAEITRLDALEIELKAWIDVNESTIAEKKQSLEDNRTNQKSTTEIRGEQKALFEKNVKNQIAAEAALTKAIEVLKVYYDELDKVNWTGTYEAITGVWTTGKGGVFTDVVSEYSGTEREEQLKKACREDINCIAVSEAGQIYVKRPEAGTEQLAGTKTMWVKQGYPAFIQQSASPDASPFSNADGESTNISNENSSTGVIGMLETYLTEVETSRADEIKEEQDNVEAYELETQNLKEEKKTLTTELENEVADLAKNNSELLQTQDSLVSEKRGKKATEDGWNAIKTNCIWIEDNYWTRKAHREGETAAMDSAITLLKGSAAFKNAEENVQLKTYEDAGCLDKCEAIGDRTQVACLSCMKYGQGDHTDKYCAEEPSTPGC